MAYSVTIKVGTKGDVKVGKELLRMSQEYYNIVVEDEQLEKLQTMKNNDIVDLKKITKIDLDTESKVQETPKIPEPKKEEKTPEPKKEEKTPEPKKEEKTPEASETPETPKETTEGEDKKKTKKKGKKEDKE